VACVVCRYAGSVHIDSIELASGAIAGVFLCVDASFFLANLVKVADGGYVPLLLGSLVYGVMLIWHRGSTTVAQIFRERPIPVNEFMSSLKAHEIRRVPGTAVFLTSVQRQASREATGVTRLAFCPELPNAPIIAAWKKATAIPYRRGMQPDLIQRANAP
jgi:K+ transporter